MSNKFEYYQNRSSGIMVSRRGHIHIPSESLMKDEYFKLQIKALDEIEIRANPDNSSKIFSRGINND